MKPLIILLFAGVLSAQDNGAPKAPATPPKNPLVATSQALFGIAKADILRSADKIPAELWNYQPTPEVRTVGQMFAHIADGQYEFCGAGIEGKSIDKGIEKANRDRAAILTALRDAFAYCDGGYAKMTDASSAELVTFFGRQASRLGIMDFNIAHTMEHYGNLVTYMRLKGIVPPSSSGGR
jgi:uncharacterized damage-inducible protein DinB